MMVAWKRTILFRYIYVTIFLGINSIFVYTEEIQNVAEPSQALTGTELDFGQKQGQALVESSIKFPTAGSFFSWIGSFNNLRNEYEQTFKDIATSIPPKEDFESHIIVMRAYSSLLQCLEIMSDIHTVYKSSVSEQNSETFSEDSYLSVDALLKECLTPCKELLLKSFIGLQDLVFESGKIYSPTLLKSSERIMELYYKCWDLFTTILGYITMLQQSMAILLRNRSEIQEKLLTLESKQERSALEQLELNIYNRKLVDSNRNEALLGFILSLLEGDFSVSVKVTEMESLITTENQRSIRELEQSIQNMGKSVKCEDQSKEESKMQLVTTLRAELLSRSDDLMRQVSGTPIYLQRYDPELTLIFENLNSGDLQSDSNNEQHGTDEETKVKGE
ncbi:uncharacterized protein ELE39_000406 [Cryptosporidium sp. chipmunk genotype I]|uniref:uncharacterized protein n=1 Tax=Cryptosporidium sp. chipmunk genotype I TaxID=1280935 RepID=UPI00351A5E2F|nr:hypothetical protein ELE39_000406 [Cryptosporidium sp. chipmunk genotype I]